MTPGQPLPRAVLFDLDEVLLDTRRAWQYTVEEAVLSVSGRRENTAPLLAEYRRRPWRDVLAVLLTEYGERARCEQLCLRIYERSAMKRLLVHEGIGMALDHVRANRIEMGAISRAPHASALKRIESTGLDRFLAVLSPTAEAGDWDVTARTADCLRFLGYPPEQCAFVSGDADDLRTAEQAGLRVFEATWASESATGCPPLAEPAAIAATLMAAWTQAGR
jgi:phosphoglycolate phosphatase-like HAD superfamily hydrolase